MAHDVQDPPRAPESTGPGQDPVVPQRTYTYLRVAMVGLLISLAVAVVWQSVRQGTQILSSVSAYYYTPAQAIFVGALIALAACMIALRGVNVVEEVALSLGGICAAAVAVVPTSRGKDYETAVAACKASGGQLLTGQASGPADCPTKLGLEAATRANVENNGWTLVIVGLLGVVAAIILTRRFAASGGRAPGRALWWGCGTAAVVLLAAGFGLRFQLDWMVGHVHYIAATGLLLSIVAVAVANAFEGQGRVVDDGSGVQVAVNGLQEGAASVVAPSSWGRDAYAWLARLMIAVTVVAGVAFALHVVQLFWLEIFVAGAFAAFWFVQTIQELPEKRRA